MAKTPFRENLHPRDRKGKFAKSPGKSLGQKPSPGKVSRAVGAKPKGSGKVSTGTTSSIPRDTTAKRVNAGDHVLIKGNLEQVLSVRHMGDGSGAVIINTKSGTYQQTQNDYLPLVAGTKVRRRRG